MKILFATHNRHKLDEVKKLLDSKIELVFLTEFNDNEKVIENGKTFFENAYKKAVFFYKKYNLPTLADDSGIVVQSLNGEPGIFSSRYAGIDGDDANNNKKLLNRLKNKRNKKAYYFCVFCFIDFLGRVTYFSGKLKGKISDKERGFNGFGYDSLFIPNGYNETLGILSKELKSKISHRSQACNKFSGYISKSKIRYDAIINYNVKKIFKTRNVIIKKRLLDGLSNYSYLVEINDFLYVYRIPGYFESFFVDRKIELDNIKVLIEQGYIEKPYYFNVYNGHKISKHTGGSSLDVLSEEDFLLCANALKKLHSSKSLFNNDYNPFERLEKYESYISKSNCLLDPRYKEFKRKIFEKKDFLLSQKKMMCHGDSQVKNFVKDETMYLIDFEFAGNNDPIYDIACYGNRNLDEGYKLLEVYFGDKLGENEKKRFFLWRFFQCLQWYNVAMFKETKGLSKELKTDFLLVSKMYLNKAEEILKKCIFFADESL